MKFWNRSGFSVTNPALFKASIALALFFLFIPHAYGEVDDYHIDSGDLLSIIVYGEEDLSLKQVRVATNGTISFPLLGEIKARGNTSKELERYLKKRLLNGYLKKPKVTVSILEYRLFYVYGEVNKPGGYKYINGLTVQKAIALAGGLTHRASRRKITLSTEGASEEAAKPVGLTNPVMPGDVMYIGESIF